MRRVEKRRSFIDLREVALVNDMLMASYNWHYQFKVGLSIDYFVGLLMDWKFDESQKCKTFKLTRLIQLMSQNPPPLKNLGFLSLIHVN